MGVQPIVSQGGLAPASLSFDETIEAMLPLRRLRADRAELRSRWEAGKPFPHIVMDGYFDEAVLDRVTGDFPKPGDRDWITWDTVNEVKQTSRGIADLSAFTQLLCMQLSSMDFVAELRQITGIPDLIGDPMFSGAGLHESFRGGWLNIHADWTKHPYLPLTRRLNLIVYLNKGWQEEWGSSLKLYDYDTKEPGAPISPVFNRAVLFPTTEFTLHGFPEPITCPVNETRKSISIYYWSPDPEVAKTSTFISFLPGSGTTKARAMARAFVPPIVYTTVRSLRNRKKPSKSDT